MKNDTLKEENLEIKTYWGCWNWEAVREAWAMKLRREGFLGLVESDEKVLEAVMRWRGREDENGLGEGRKA